MYEFMEQSEGAVVGIRVAGRLTKEEYHQIVPRLERLIDEHGPIRLLFEMRDFHGWKPGALWEDLKFDARHLADAERVALVGDRPWEELLASLGKPFTTAEIRYFDLSAEDEAWAWLREPR